MSRQKRPTPFGLNRAKGGRYPCGVCGVAQKMTAAHVPPQCAGNGPQVLSTTATVTPDGQIRRLPARQGGMSVYGLCDPCNNTAGVLYDKQYKEFADLLRPHWVREWTLELPRTIGLPAGSIRPGAVARSILLGMAALTPTWMFENWPTFMPSLLKPETSPVLPDDAHLMMAYSRGQTGRLEGFSTTITNPRHVPLISYASVYFAPLAWQLVASDNVRSMKRLGWAEVSNWVKIPVDETHDVSELVRNMTATTHPLHDPRQRHGVYAHMASDQTSVLSKHSTYSVATTKAQLSSRGTSRNKCSYRSPKTVT